MTWRDRAEALVGRFDKKTQLAIPGVFLGLLPARDDLGRFVAGVFEALARRRPGGPRLPDFPAADAPRLEELFTLLEGPLGELCEQVAALANTTRAPRAFAAALRRPEVAAARARLAELAKEGLRPFPPRGRATQLDALPLAEGLQLGCWHVWESRTGIGVLLHNAATGRLVRLWPGSNGWWELRGRRMGTGEVHIVWSAGNTSPKSDEAYTDVADAPGPCWTFPPGKYIAEDWRFFAGKCELLITHAPTRRVITLGLASPLIRCNDAELPEV